MSKPFALFAALGLLIASPLLTPGTAQDAQPSKKAKPIAHAAGLVGEAACARCDGETPCNACTNCSRCAWCKGGGTCGVCAPGGGVTRGSSRSGGGGGSGRRSYSESSATFTPAPRPKPKPTPTPEPKLPDEFVARVVGVTDGDTLTVATGSGRRVTVRLYGIDAPELAQSFGPTSKKTLADLAYDREVTVYVSSTEKKGRNPVVSAVVSLGGKKMNEAQVGSGMAWWNPKSAPSNATLKSFHTAAKTAKRGLWRNENPVAPWEFRQKSR